MPNPAPGCSLPGRLLYLNNYRNAQIPEALDRRFAGYGFAVDVRHAWSDPMPDSPQAYAAVFLSGSEISPWEDFPWIGDQRRLIRQIAASRTPALGICFGTQILAYELLGPQTVFRRDHYEIGLVDVFIASGNVPDPLVVGLPQSFPAFTWHRDEVVAAHPDMRVLATGRACANHLWRYRDLPIWGAQVHPEAGGDLSSAWLRHHRTMLTRAGLDLAHRDYAAGFQTPAAATLIDNFARFALGRDGRHAHG